MIQTLPRTTWRLGPAALAVATVVVVVSAIDLMPFRLALTLGALGLMAADAAESDQRLAWWLGFLLPVDFIVTVEPLILDVARYGALAWLCIRFRPTLSDERRPLLLAFAMTLGLVAIIRGTASVARADRFGIYIAVIMLVGSITAPLIARRVQAHRQLLGGFMGGVVLSSVVSLSQALDLPTLTDGNVEGGRFPGLASTTMLFTWHLAFALIIATYFLATRDPMLRNRLAAFVVIPLGIVSLLVNGAQGGLGGLALAALAVTAFSWRSWSWHTVGRWLAGTTVLIGMIVVLLAASGVRTATIDGILGEGNYENELARWQVAVDGWNETAANPLVGVGRTNFEDEYDLAPHFLPLEAGVTAGIGALLIGSVLIVLILSVIVRGPVGRTPSAWLGLALTAAMLGYAIISSGGPFAGLPRFTLLLIAVLACRGEAWPATQSAPRTPATADDTSGYGQPA